MSIRSADDLGYADDLEGKQCQHYRIYPDNMIDPDHFDMLPVKTGKDEMTTNLFPGKPTLKDLSRAALKYRKVILLLLGKESSVHERTRGGRGSSIKDGEGFITPPHPGQYNMLRILHAQYVDALRA